MHLPKSRWYAFASHFGLSLLIFLALLLVITLLWYPGALFTAAGGWQGIKIIVGVDLVIGPLLTLIIYNTAKPRKLLYMDLLVIALIQLSCLAAGIFIVFDERPLAVTYVHDKFYVLKKSDFIGAGKDTESLGLPMMTPKMFYVDLSELAESKKGEETIAALHEMVGKHLIFRTDLYRPIPEDQSKLDLVFRYNQQPHHSDHHQSCITVELITAYHAGVACYDRENHRLDSFIDTEKTAAATN
jgi:hypothetical protein